MKQNLLITTRILKLQVKEIAIVYILIPLMTFSK